MVEEGVEVEVDQEDQEAVQGAGETDIKLTLKNTSDNCLERVTISSLLSVLLKSCIIFISEAV